MDKTSLGLYILFVITSCDVIKSVILDPPYWISLPSQKVGKQRRLMEN